MNSNSPNSLQSQYLFTSQKILENYSKIRIKEKKNECEKIEKHFQSSQKILRTTGAENKCNAHPLRNTVTKKKKKKRKENNQKIFIRK